MSRFLAFCAGIAIAWSGAVDAQSSLPDPRVTPGAVYYTDHVEACAFNRSTPRLSGPEYREMAHYIFELYRIPYSRHREYELDHRIPRGVGGADEILNLWPQPRAGSCNAYDKDDLERVVIRRVCRDNSMTVVEGQSLFRGDWRAAYRSVLGKSCER